MATKVVEGPAVDGVLDDAAWAQAAAVDTFTPVSYTHLTLPTSDLV